MTFTNIYILAAFVGNLTIVELLLEHNADTEARDLYLLSSFHLCSSPPFATSSCSPFSLSSLSIYLCIFFDKLRHDQTPLHVAAFLEYTEIVTFLIRQGADIEARSHQLTPLHLAARWGRAEIVSELLKLGADVRAKDR